MPARARAQPRHGGAGVGKPPVKEPAGRWADRRRKRYGDFNVAAAQIGSVSCGCERRVRRTGVAPRLSSAIFLRTPSSFAALIWPVSWRPAKRLRGRTMTGSDKRHCRCGWTLGFHEVSILITAGALARYRGMHPRSKTSMIRMRPPQDGQGCSGRSGACASTLPSAGTRASRACGPGCGRERGRRGGRSAGCGAVPSAARG